MIETIGIIGAGTMGNGIAQICAAAGLQVTIAVSSTERITGTLTDFSNGLPDLPGMSVTDRSAEYMPAPFDFRDPTVVRTLLEL